MIALPFTITPMVLKQVAIISEQVGRLEASLPDAQQVLLRRGNRIRTIQGSLAIEGNTLSLDQVTAVIEGKRLGQYARNTGGARCCGCLSGTRWMEAKLAR